MSPVMAFFSFQVTSPGTVPPVAPVCTTIKVLWFKPPLILGVLFTVWGDLKLTGFASMKE